MSQKHATVVTFLPTLQSLPSQLLLRICRHLHPDHHYHHPFPPHHGHNSLRADKPIQHPSRLDWNWSHGPLHVLPPNQRRLQSHHLHPNPLLGPTSPLSGCPLGRLPQNCRLPIRRRLLHRRLPIRHWPRYPPPIHWPSLRFTPRRHHR